MNKTLFYPESLGQRLNIMKEQNMHSKKMKIIGPSLKIHIGLRLPQFKSKNKKEIMALEKCTIIEKNNRLLLQKMINIHKRKSLVKKQNSISYDYKEVHSLNLLWIHHSITPYHISKTFAHSSPTYIKSPLASTNHLIILIFLISNSINSSWTLLIQNSKQMIILSGEYKKLHFIDHGGCLIMLKKSLKFIAIPMI